MMWSAKLEEFRENEAVVEAWVEPKSGGENIWFHIVTLVNTATLTEGGPAFNSIEHVIDALQNLPTPKPNWTYYSIFNQDGARLETSVPKDLVG